MKALIAGGGIAGLMAGIAIRQAGHEVEIFERSPELREIGAGLMIWPNGSRSLEALDVEVHALPLERLSLVDWRGRTLMEFPMDLISERYGHRVTFVSRTGLQAGLVAKLGRECLHLGADVRDFTQDASRVEVRLRDGAVASGDLLVGADGLRSVVRRQLLDDGDPVYLGSTIWRGVVGNEGIALDRGHGINWFGRGAEFIAFDLPDDRIYWAGVTREPRGERAGPGGHKQDLLERFAAWPDPISALITQTEEGAILRNDMYDRRPVRRWSRGRVTLLGDAAHPMTPNQGQGACQALEDAVALGAGLARAPNLTEALSAYEESRVRRANRVVVASRQATRGVQLANPLLCAIRDALPRLLPPRLLLRMLDGTLSAPVRDKGVT